MWFYTPQLQNKIFTEMTNFKTLAIFFLKAFVHSRFISRSTTSIIHLEVIGILRQSESQPTISPQAIS